MAITADEGAKRIAQILTRDCTESCATVKTCKTCGTQFDAYRHGCVEMTICRECLSARISDRLTGKAERTNSGDNSVKIAVDFSQYLELYEAISTTAKKEFRSVQQQILYALDRWANP